MLIIVWQGRGDAVTRQQTSRRAQRTGFFELLATVAGQFLQDDGHDQDVSKFDETVHAIQQTGNDVSDIISMHEGHKLMRVDPNSTVDNGVSESASLKNEVGNPIKKAGDVNHGPHFGCLKLTKWNPLMLQELPIPFFVKEITMETITATTVDEVEVGSFAFTCSKTIGIWKFLKFWRALVF